jgi:hypothetical protein
MNKKNARLTEAKPSAQRHAHLITPTVTATPRRGRDGWVLKLTCPHCGETHTHGGGDGPVARGGHRVAHCRRLHDVVGYFIDPDADKSARGAI